MSNELHKMYKEFLRFRESSEIYVVLLTKYGGYDPTTVFCLVDLGFFWAYKWSGATCIQDRWAAKHELIPFGSKKERDNFLRKQRYYNGSDGQ